MISVVILINGEPVMARSATRVSGNDGEVCTYHIDDGTTLRHNHNKGCVPLAIAMLKTIKEASK